jgi:hypothetical protein
MKEHWAYILHPKPAYRHIVFILVNVVNNFHNKWESNQTNLNV